MKDNLVSILDIPDTDIQRISTGMPGFDEFLGGGLVPGTAILFAGEPGVGKSTLLLQIAYKMAETGQKVLYATGEESLAQIKLRANRIQALHPNIFCTDKIQLEAVSEMAEQIEANVVIVDSLQMVYSDSMTKEPGSKAQITYCLSRLIDLARLNGRTLITVGHSNKTGGIAGLQTLQHMVDVTLYMYASGGENRRIFSKKNRYGLAQVNWEIQMKQEGIVDPLHKQINQAVRITTIAVPNSEIKDMQKDGRTLVLPHKAIQSILSNSGKLDRWTIKSDMRWLFQKQFGKELDDSIEYDIIYSIKD
jgi:DNA repair protein RadA/Sms